MATPIKRQPTLVRANAFLELMDLESSVGNRVAFERFRVAAEEHDGRMSPSMAVDYQYKVGIGLGRLGQLRRARDGTDRGTRAGRGPTGSTPGTSKSNRASRRLTDARSNQPVDEHASGAQ